MSSELVRVRPVYDDRQMEIIREQIAKGVSDDELKYFLEVCRLTGLNPLQKQIYAIMRWSDGKQRMTIQTGIDGYRLLAARTRELAGIDDAVYDSEEGEHPKRATVTVYRKAPYGGERVAFTATARWSEYVQTNKEGKPTSMWAKMPYLMLGKCAEALALRKAFPAELSGIYTAEEMAQADSEPFRPEPVDPTPAKRTRKPEMRIVEQAVEQSPARFSELDDAAITTKSRALAAQLDISDVDYGKQFYAQVNDGKPIPPNEITREMRENWYGHLIERNVARLKAEAQAAFDAKRAEEAKQADQADLSELDPNDVKVS